MLTGSRIYAPAAHKSRFVLGPHHKTALCHILTQMSDKSQTADRQQIDSDRQPQATTDSYTQQQTVKYARTLCKPTHSQRTGPTKTRQNSPIVMTTHGHSNIDQNSISFLAQAVGAAEYTNCFSAEG